jgi:cob(I)alamin adenosyltransferase
LDWRGNIGDEVHLAGYPRNIPKSFFEHQPGQSLAYLDEYQRNVAGRFPEGRLTLLRGHIVEVQNIHGARTWWRRNHHRTGKSDW